jgi:hypothetical protein
MAIVEVVDPPTAFEVFTEEVAAWWSSESRFEPGVGGRGNDRRSRWEPVEIGRVLVWEPGPPVLSYRRDRGRGLRRDIGGRVSLRDPRASTAL